MYLYILPLYPVQKEIKKMEELAQSHKDIARIILKNMGIQESTYQYCVHTFT